jgi:predicted RNA-binding Zn-ribbon protein involved in translation (DUF1610 family)
MSEQQEPWTGQVPPHGAEFIIDRQDTPAGRLVSFTCPDCGARLAAFIVGNPKSKLRPRWWECRKCGCNRGVGRLQA